MSIPQSSPNNPWHDPIRILRVYSPKSFPTRQSPASRTSRDCSRVQTYPQVALKALNLAPIPPIKLQIRPAAARSSQQPQSNSSSTPASTQVSARIRSSQGTPPPSAKELSVYNYSKTMEGQRNLKLEDVIFNCRFPH